MNISTSIDKTQINAVAIGKFDGMHAAHQELFKQLGEKGAILVIDTGDFRLTPGERKQEYTEYPIFYYALDNIRNLEGEEFIRKIREDFPSVEKIVVGYDFRFGKGRHYCAEDIEEIFPLEVVIVNEVRINGISVHAGIIRELLKHGDIEAANTFLTRPYRMSGKAITGQGIGKKQLFPTINLDVKDYIMPDEGVYATRTLIEGQVYDSVSFIGHRVSTDRQFSVETHILNDEPPACESADILFYKKIRDNKRYTDLEVLKERIKKDIIESENILEQIPC